MTTIDDAHAGMQAAPDNDSARLAFYDTVASCEMFLLLETDPQGDAITPRLFPVDDDTYALAFDREDRLSEFAGTIAPYASLSGRVLAQMLAGQSIGLGINIDVAPSAILLPATAIAWLHQTLENAPSRIDATPSEILPPGALPDHFIASLDRKLASATGLARSAYLCEIAYDTGTKNHMLAFIDAQPDAATALSRAVNEALIFSGIDAGSLDVAFFTSTDVMAPKLAKVGLRFDLPQPAEKTAATAPGSDPEKPPRLR